MNYAALRTLIETHPTHGSTSDADMVTWLNDPAGVNRNRARMPITELVEVMCAFPSDLTGLSAAKDRALSHIVSGVTDFDLTNNTPVREALEDIFAGTSILTELASRLTEDVSRAEDAGFSRFIRADHVTHARTYGD